MKEEDLFDLTFDLTLAVIRKRGDGRITSIQPYESQGERTICVSYDEQQARIAVVFHQSDYIQIRCSFTFTSFVQTFEYVFDDKMTKKQKEKILDIPEFKVAAEAQEDNFDVPVGGIETDIVLGDLFEIGGHRLLCGDSTDSDSVAIS